MYVKGWHIFHFNMPPHSPIAAASHTAVRMLFLFLSVWIQNNSTAFDVNAWQQEPDSTALSFIHQLPPMTCWLYAPTTLFISLFYMHHVACQNELLYLYEASWTAQSSPAQCGLGNYHRSKSCRAAFRLLGWWEALSRKGFLPKQKRF